MGKAMASPVGKDRFGHVPSDRGCIVDPLASEALVLRRIVIHGHPRDSDVGQAAIIKVCRLELARMERVLAPHLERLEPRLECYAGRS